MGVATLVGIGICAVSLIVLHLLPTGLSPLRHPVSQYGITHYWIGYRVQSVAMGVSAIGAALGIGQVAISGRHLAIALLWVFGVARLMISWFPMDAPGSIRTERGRRHGILAIVAFGAATASAIHLGGVLNSAGLWGGAATAIEAIGALMLAGLVAMSTIRRRPLLRTYFGAVERMFYVGAISYLVVIGFELVSGGLAR